MGVAIDGRYAGRLRELPFVNDARFLAIEPRREGQFRDAILQIRTPGGAHQFVVENKTTPLTWAVVNALVARHDQHQEAWVLFAPHIGRKMARHLTDRKINFMDQVGNCHITIGDEHIAMIEGRPRPVQPTRGRGLGRAGNQVLFAILAEPGLLDLPVRQVAHLAGVGKTAVANAFNRLEEEGLVGRGRKTRPILQREQILERWLAGYTAIVRPQAMIGRYRTADRDPMQLERTIEDALGDRTGWAWGGGAAAMRLDRYYRGTETILHVARRDGDLPACCKALPDRNGTLTILLTPGPLALQGAVPRTVHPLLVYTELVVSNDKRAIDAAGRIRDRFLWGA